MLSRLCVQQPEEQRSPIELARIAVSNGARLAQRLASVGDEAVNELATFIKNHAALAVSMGGVAIERFLVDGEYRNIYQLAYADAARAVQGEPTPAAINEIVRGLLASAFSDGGSIRSLLDDQVAFGVDHVYGYLYAGGHGASGYGPYCVVLQAPPLGPEVVALLAHDSIDLSDRYFELGGDSVDRCKLAAECASWGERDALAALKLQRSIKLSAEKETWPDLLASPSSYIEIRMTGPVPRSAIKTILYDRQRLFGQQTGAGISVELWCERKRFERIRVLAQGIPVMDIGEYLNGVSQ